MPRYRSPGRPWHNKRLVGTGQVIHLAASIPPEQRLRLPGEKEMGKARFHQVSKCPRSEVLQSHGPVISEEAKMGVNRKLNRTAIEPQIREVRSLSHDKTETGLLHQAACPPPFSRSNL